jgi:predicted nucleic acid-binding protein
MILFCDTSALVKLCVSETNSTLVSDRVNDAEAVAVCRNAWAKAQVTFAGRVGDNPDNTALKYV